MGKTDWFEEKCLTVKDGLFADVNYYMAGNVPEMIDSLLKCGGGKKNSYLSDMVSHVIAGDGDDDEISVAKELYQLPVVTISWVLKSIQCCSLLPTGIFDPSTQFFSGVVVCPSQLSAKDNKIIYALVTCFGGKYQLVLNKCVTHLISTRTDGAKYDYVCLHQNKSIKIVTPDWILDCVHAKSRLNELQFHPRLIIPSSADANLKPELNLSGLHEGVASLNLTSGSQQQCIPQGNKEISSVADTASRKDHVTINQSSLSSANSSVNRVNVGDVPNTYDDINLCKQPVLASSSHVSRVPFVQLHEESSRESKNHLKNIGSNNDILSRFHKQSSKSGCSTKNVPFVVSNTPIAPQIHQLTAQHSTIGTMHNVSSRMSIDSNLKSYFGHDTLEHVPQDLCLLGCVFYITDYQKFIDSSALEMWRQVIVQYGGQVDESYSNRITHVLCEHQKSDVFQLALRDGKRLVTAHWLNDCLSLQKMEVPYAALHFPYIFGKERPGCNQLISVTNFEGTERYRVKQMLVQIGAQYTGYMTRANSVLIAKHARGAKYMKALEWNIPVVSVKWLNDVVLGDLHALKVPLHSRYRVSNNTNHSSDMFCVDPGKVSHLLEGWKTPVKISKETWKKFHGSHLIRLSNDKNILNHLGNANENTSSNPLQKQKLDGDHCSPEKKLRFSDSIGIAAVPLIVITGIQEDEITRLSKDIQKLGGQIAQSCHDGCTHLVSNSVMRTVKFLTAFGYVKHFVTSDWIVQSSLAGRFLDENCFELHDAKMEETFNFSLHTSLLRAKERLLFKDLTFYFTPDVRPSKPVLCEIVKSCGGKVVVKLPSLKHIVKFISSKGQPTFIIVSCESDLYMLHDINSHDIGIHNAEFVLTGVMRQEIDLSAYRMN